MGLFENTTPLEKNAKEFTKSQTFINKCEEAGFTRGVDKYSIKHQFLDIVKKENVPVNEFEIRLDKIISDIEAYAQQLEDQEAEKKVLNKKLYDETQSTDKIKESINQDMENLASHEAGTKWMRMGTLVSFDSTQQIIGAGLKALIDQNKILIRQNELLRRQNDEIIELLKKEE